jgi:hypothetical protein
MFCFLSPWPVDLNFNRTSVVQRIDSRLHPFKGYLFPRSLHRQIDLGRFPVVNRQFTQFLDGLVHRFQRWTTVTLVGWTVLLLALHEVFGLIHISLYFPLLILSFVLMIVLY